MSKIKDQMERDRDFEMEQYYSFMEWVCDQEQEVSENTTNEEEEDIEMSSTPRTSIVPANTLKAANNINYNPYRSTK